MRVSRPYGLAYTTAHDKQPPPIHYYYCCTEMHWEIIMQLLGWVRHHRINWYNSKRSAFALITISLILNRNARLSGLDWKLAHSLSHSCPPPFGCPLPTSSVHDYITIIISVIGETNSFENNLYPATMCLAVALLFGVNCTPHIIINLRIATANVISISSRLVSPIKLYYYPLTLVVPIYLLVFLPIGAVVIRCGTSNHPKPTNPNMNPSMCFRERGEWTSKEKCTAAKECKDWFN